MAEKTWNGNGRPSNDEVLVKRSRFLCLIADGKDADAAALEAGLSFRRALKIVTESDYLDVVRAIREGAGPVVAIVEPADGKLAA